MVEDGLAIWDAATETDRSEILAHVGRRAAASCKSYKHVDRQRTDHLR